MRQRILITGATDGIGLSLARIYQAAGARVIIVGRRPPSEVARELRDDYCRADLAQVFGPTLVAEFLHRRVEGLDLLIHCAGVGFYGRAEDQPPEEVDTLLDTNLRAPIALTHALLPLLMASRGRVVFVGSVAAALPTPEYAVYGATKAGLEGFARSLRVELRGQVGVQVIHPGATRTAMHAKAGAPLDRIGWRRFPPPERSARRIARAIEAGAAVTATGAENRLLRLAGRHLGWLVDRAVAGRADRERRDSRPFATRSLGRSGVHHCVVTGGADGIGRAVAERYAHLGYEVTIIDRDPERGEAVCVTLRRAGATARFVQADLGESGSVAAALAALGRLPPADVVVHSAGISAVGPFARSDLARQQEVIDVNLRAPLLLTAGMLRAGLVAPGGTLVFIASLSVFSGYPGAAVYAASKDGIAAYARSMRAALRPWGSHVLTVYPGPTRTAHARRYSPDNRREGSRMPPERLAALVERAVRRRQPALVPGAGNRLAALVGRLFPAVMEKVMRKTMLEPLERREAAGGIHREGA
jgi:short-subunit dehydrogenase